MVRWKKMIALRNDFAMVKYNIALQTHRQFCQMLWTWLGFDFAFELQPRFVFLRHACSLFAEGRSPAAREQSLMQQRLWNNTSKPCRCDNQFIFPVQRSLISNTFFADPIFPIIIMTRVLYQPLRMYDRLIAEGQTPASEGLDSRARTSMQWSMKLPHRPQSQSHRSQQRRLMCFRHHTRRINPMHACRLGEAKNPGPRMQPAKTQNIRFAVTNPTSVLHKATELAELKADVLMLSETSATPLAQGIASGEFPHVDIKLYGDIRPLRSCIMVIQIASEGPLLGYPFIQSYQSDTHVITLNQTGIHQADSCMLLYNCLPLNFKYVRCMDSLLP